MVNVGVGTNDTCHSQHCIFSSYIFCIVSYRFVSFLFFGNSTYHQEAGVCAYLPPKKFFPHVLTIRTLVQEKHVHSIGFLHVVCVFVVSKWHMFCHWRKHRWRKHPPIPTKTTCLCVWQKYVTSFHNTSFFEDFIELCSEYFDAIIIVIIIIIVILPQSWQSFQDQ